MLFHGQLDVAPKPGGLYEVSVESIYHWQDTIHTDQKHHPHPWLNTAADLLTVGAADPYRLDLSYRSQARYAMDATGSVHEMEGYSAS